MDNDIEEHLTDCGGMMPSGPERLAIIAIIAGGLIGAALLIGWGLGWMP